MDFETFKSFISMSMNGFKNFMSLSNEEKQLLLDVTLMRRKNAGTGIQRVITEILKNIITYYLINNIHLII